MRAIRRVGMVLTAAGALWPGGVAGQAAAAGRDAYFGAVAEYFALPAAEVSILGEWRLPDDEIPVVLFLARKAGVSPEAVVALRRSGGGWSELAARYGLGADQFHVALRDGAPAGVLADAYARFRALPAPRWGEVTLSDREVVGLVNLKVLAQTLRRSPEEILVRAERGTWVEAYLRFIGDARPD